MKKAFTLIELLIVVGIVAVLATIMLVSFGGGSESAKAAKCLSNMKNLANACQTYGMATGHYPLAGSIEKVTFDESRGIKNVRMAYYELPGWISWNSAGAYQSSPQSHVASASWFQSAYNQDLISSTYCLTNGGLWKYVSETREVYFCPTHAKHAKFRNRPPQWSYVMNAYFGWDDSIGARPKNKNYCGIEYGKLARADRRLLFAEMPFDNVSGIDVKTGAGAGIDCDCTLQYKKDEVIGFNHTQGKRERYAHVVFADGHAEKLRWPKGGLSNSNLKELTKWLCEATDVSFNGSQYEEMK